MQYFQAVNIDNERAKQIRAVILDSWQRYENYHMFHHFNVLYNFLFKNIYLLLF